MAVSFSLVSGQLASWAPRGQAAAVDSCDGGSHPTSLGFAAAESVGLTILFCRPSRRKQQTARPKTRRALHCQSTTRFRATTETPSGPELPLAGTKHDLTLRIALQSPCDRSSNDRLPAHDFVIRITLPPRKCITTVSRVSRSNSVSFNGISKATALHHPPKCSRLRLLHGYR